MFDEVRFLFPAIHCHAHITNQLYSKTVTSSAAENGEKWGPKRAQKLPQNQVGKYEKL